MTTEPRLFAAMRDLPYGFADELRAVVKAYLATPEASPRGRAAVAEEGGGDVMAPAPSSEEA